ncbi:MAG: glycosyltransferase family 2 protein [Mycoplasmataceae bacterium]|nr:glycosyltransferase family 2 protein [Mycoplasmataceae bacterium]
MELKPASTPRPLLTVIIPCHEFTEELANVLNSINFKAIGRAIEVFVVDDRYDNTIYDFVLPYLEKYSTQIFYYKSNGGTVKSSWANAVKTGLIYSTGAFIKIIDTDDSFDFFGLPILMDDLYYVISKAALTPDLVISSYDFSRDGFNTKTSFQFSNAIKGARSRNIVNSDKLTIKENLSYHSLVFKRDIFEKFKELSIDTGTSELHLVLESIRYANKVMFTGKDLNVVNYSALSYDEILIPELIGEHSHNLLKSLEFNIDLFDASGLQGKKKENSIRMLINFIYHVLLAISLNDSITPAVKDTSCNDVKKHISKKFSDSKDFKNVIKNIDALIKTKYNLKTTHKIAEAAYGNKYKYFEQSISRIKKSHDTKKKVPYLSSKEEVRVLPHIKKNTTAHVFNKHPLEKH